MKRKDITGERFGRLVVIEYAGSSKRGQATWRCRCDCGNEIIALGNNLRRGHTTSCGCLSKDNPHHSTHKMTNTRLYKIYVGMIGRCYNPNYTRYEHWGGRGIKVCDEWKNDKTKFFEWALSNGYDDSLQIDRIDNNGDYCPENCRFVTPKDNSNNRSTNIKLTDGVRIYRSIRECSDANGYPHTTLWRYVKNGTLEKHTNFKIVK